MLDFFPIINMLSLTVDWVYTYVESIYLYDYRIVYFWLFKNTFNGTHEYVFSFIYYSSLNTSGIQLLWSLLADNVILTYVSNAFFTENWARNFFTSRDASLFIVYHPEILFFKQQMLDNYLINSVAEINVGLIELLESKSLITPILLLPQLMLLIFYCLLLISFYFSFFSSSSKEESTIDCDYLTASTTVEAEKEIGSLDDLVVPIICLTYIFGWYFYINSYYLLLLDNSFCITWSVVPLLYYAIINTPTTLLLDFGIFYICCLRGVAPTTCIVFELIYDLITLIAFYVRVLIQGVRLVLICYTYMSLHDFVLYSDFNHNFYGSAYQSIWEDLAKIDSSECTITYFILFYLPAHIFNWIYELIHVFFVVTGQLVSYLAMIFWLFLFLFTFFVLYKQEQFFEERRLFRSKMLIKYKKLNLLKKPKL